MNRVSYIANFCQGKSKPKLFFCTWIASNISNLPRHLLQIVFTAFNRDEDTYSKSGLYLSPDHRQRTFVLECLLSLCQWMH
jgi:hypothetical protein